MIYNIWWNYAGHETEKGGGGLLFHILLCSKRLELVGAERIMLGVHGF